MSDFATQVAQRRVDRLATEQQFVERQAELQAALDSTGLSAVQTAELRIISADLDALDASREREYESETAAESAWLRAAEYDPRMDDPREW